MVRLLRSSANSWLRTLPDATPVLQAYPELGFPVEGERAVRTLAVSVRGSFDSYFKDRPSPFEAGLPQEVTVGGTEESPPPELGQESLFDRIRLNVYSNIIGQTDDQPVFDEEGREIQDRVRVRKTDFDFRAPLASNADAVVIATLESDPVSDYDGDLEEAFARIRLFEGERWETHLVGGQFRSRFGRNNRLRVFELPRKPESVSGETPWEVSVARAGILVPAGSRHVNMSWRVIPRRSTPSAETPRFIVRLCTVMSPASSEDCACCAR